MTTEEAVDEGEGCYLYEWAVQRREERKDKQKKKETNTQEVQFKK